MKKIIIVLLFYSSLYLSADVVTKNVMGYPLYQDGGCGNNMEQICFTYQQDFPSPFKEDYKDWGEIAVSAGERFNYFSSEEAGPYTNSTQGVGYINAVLTEDFIYSNNRRPNFTTDGLTQVFYTYGDWKNNLPDPQLGGQ